MVQITIVGKDWGFFATSLAEDLTDRNIKVLRRFISHDALADSSSSASHKIVSYSKRLFRRLEKPFWVYRATRHLADLAALIWWLTGVIGSSVVVVSAVPTILQTKIFISLCRSLHKQVILCVHGTDARPPFLNGLYFEGISALSGANAAKFVGKFEEKVSIASAKSSAVISWMGSAHYIPGPCFLFEEIGYPLRHSRAASGLPETSETQILNGQSGFFRVIHAPSSIGKGSGEIRRVVEELTTAGYPLQFHELVGLPNRKVWEELAKSDLVVDQIYSDNFSGVLAREAAACSRWVIVGGNSLDAMEKTDWNLPPVMVSSAEHLKGHILWCFENRDILPQKAESLQSHFLDRKFTDFFIATFITTTFGKNSPARSQLRKPFIDFHPGYGGYGPDQDLKEMIHKVVQEAGITGLHLPEAFVAALLTHYGIELDESRQRASGPISRESNQPDKTSTSVETPPSAI